MKNTFKYGLIALAVVAIVVSLGWYLYVSNVQVLNPKGLIAEKERNLLFIATALMLIVVIPVFVLTFVLAYKYRASNEKAKYTPDWDHHVGIETVWWGFPFAIIIALAIITWYTSHELDPFRPIVNGTKPMTIQVVALPWKWLFIYPEEGIASVNFLQFPNETPLNFEITGDSPMNSFWIPQLGGQIYAMPGMKTYLHLIAHDVGSYNGNSANLSGDGFSEMKFIAKSSSKEDYLQWVQTVKGSGSDLTLDAYKTLAKPSVATPVAYYVIKEKNLFDWILMKYMSPTHEMNSIPHKG